MSNILSRNVRWLSELAVSKFQKRDPDLWGFGEWMGNRCCDNSLSLANYIVENHPEKKVVWFSKKGGIMKKPTAFLHMVICSSK